MAIFWGKVLYLFDPIIHHYPSSYVDFLALILFQLTSSFADMINYSQKKTLTKNINVGHNRLLSQYDHFSEDKIIILLFLLSISCYNTL